MKKIKQLRQKSKERKDRINDTEERLRQLKNQEKYWYSNEIMLNYNQPKKDEIMENRIEKYRKPLGLSQHRLG